MCHSLSKSKPDVSDVTLWLIFLIQKHLNIFQQIYFFHRTELSCCLRQTLHLTRCSGPYPPLAAWSPSCPQSWCVLAPGPPLGSSTAHCPAGWRCWSGVTGRAPLGCPLDGSAGPAADPVHKWVSRAGCCSGTRLWPPDRVPDATAPAARNVGNAVGGWRCRAAPQGIHQYLGPLTGPSWTSCRLRSWQLQRRDDQN